MIVIVVILKWSLLGLVTGIGLGNTSVRRHQKICVKDQYLLNANSLKDYFVSYVLLLITYSYQ